MSSEDAGGCGYSHLAHANDLEPSIRHRYLLEQCPVHREVQFEPPFMVVSPYAEVLELLLAPDRFVNGTGPGVFVQQGGVLGSADAPDHRRQRNVLQDAFRPRAIAALTPHVEQRGRTMWQEAFGADGEGDFISLFAFAFPAQVIAELLGVPTDRRDDFGAWSDDIVRGLGGGDLARVERANEHIFALVDALLDERLERIAGGSGPGDDVMGRLAGAHHDGVLRRSEVRRLCQQLLVAGHETTSSLLGLMLYRLITQPTLWNELRTHPERWDAAVEEFLRFDAPVQGLFRSTVAHETVGGVEIAPGTKVQLLFAAANRDPQVWDDPDTIRFDRHGVGTRPHLSFGWGVHHCIGAPLARREARLTLELILTTFDSVELTGPVAVNDPFVLRGLTTLPIRWRRAPVAEAL